MKTFKFLLLLSFGMLLTVGSLQAQNKKSCTLPCTKAKTASVEKVNSATTPVMMINQETGEAIKNCKPKNCKPNSCKGSKAAGTSSAAAMKVAETEAPVAETQKTRVLAKSESLE